jgi:transposase
MMITEEQFHRIEDCFPKQRGNVAVFNLDVHMVAADARTAVTFSLSPGQHGDGPCGRALMRTLPFPDAPTALIMDRAYEGDETRQLVFDLGYFPVVPPKSGRINPWSYDEAMYRRRKRD